MEVVRLGQETADALAFCQRKNIIHRDVKPENIFISEAGQFKLGDFGVAKTAASRSTGGSHKGTERYMAPEVFLNQPYGPTVDLYSLGLVLYRLLNGGRLPFLPPAPKPLSFGDYENAQIRRMQGAPIPPPAKADAALASIVLKACAFRSADRFRSAAEFKGALDAYVSSHPDGVTSALVEDLPVQFQEGPFAIGWRSQEPEAAQNPDENQAQAADGRDHEEDRGQTVGSWDSDGKTEGTVGGWGSPEAAEMPPEGTVGGWSRPAERLEEPEEKPDSDRTAEDTEKESPDSPASGGEIPAGIQKNKKTTRLLLVGGLLVCLVATSGIWFAKTRGNSHKGGQEYEIEGERLPYRRYPGVRLRV